MERMGHSSTRAALSARRLQKGRLRGSAPRHLQLPGRAALDLRKLPLGPPRCELPAARSLAVVGAGHQCDGGLRESLEAYEVGVLDSCTGCLSMARRGDSEDGDLGRTAVNYSPVCNLRGLMAFT